MSTDVEIHEFIKERLPADDLYVRSSQSEKGIRFAAWLGGRVVGEMSITVEPLVHDMTIQGGTLQRKIADALFQYASGYVRASGFSEALVLVSDTNERMQRYVEARATPEEPGKAYLMEVK